MTEGLTVQIPLNPSLSLCPWATELTNGACTCYLWQGAEDSGGFRTPDSQGTSIAHYTFGQKDIPLTKLVC